VKKSRVGKRQLILVGILVALLFSWGEALASETSAYPPAETGHTYKLDEIVVSATRSETPAQDVAANVTVVSREEIEKMPADTAAEVLQYVPGVYVEFNGGVGSSATVRIQGSDVSQVAVFQDNVPLNILANPQTDLSYIPVDSIERIEVYKGAASSAWGSALGGVINIITREPDAAKPFSANVQSSYGKADTFKNSANASGTVDRLGYFLSGTYDGSDGFFEDSEKNSKYSQKAAYGKLNYELTDASKAGFIYSYDSGNVHDPLITYPDFWDDIDQDRAYQKLFFETQPSKDIHLTLEGRHHEFDSFIEDVYADHREIYNDYTEETWGSSVRLTTEAMADNSLNIGFDGDWGKYEWQNYVDTHHTGNWAVYTNDTYDWRDFSFNMGVRNDNNQDFGSEVSPSAGIVYKIPAADALVRTQIARGFSAPPPALVKDPVWGNPNLEPETAVNYQLGAEMGMFKFLRTSVNLFRADVDDLLKYDPEIRKYINIAEVTRQGVEATVGAAFDFGFSVSFSGAFTDVKDEETDKVIKDIPRVQYTAITGYTYRWMTHSLIGKYIDNNSTYPETRDKRFVFDYMVDVRMPKWNNYVQTGAFCTIHNIFNTRYVYREVWPQPDRWAEGGIRLVF